MFKDQIKQMRSPKDDIIRYLFNSRIISRMFLEVCSSCQYNCRNCQHSSFRSVYKDYHLTINELYRFLYYTKKSRYYIREICIHGVGEPTLWKHLNEGIKILHASNVIGSVYVLSNGGFLDNILEETFDYIDRIRISNYPESNQSDLLLSLYKRFPGKIKIENMSHFQELPDKMFPGTTPCKCLCHFPTFIKDKILYCNGSAFEAAKLKGVNLLDCCEMYTELKENYLDDEKRGYYDLCQYCCLNNNISKQLKWHPHKMI